MPDAPFVELQQAWSWVCPLCKQLNYTRGNTCTDPEIIAALEALDDAGSPTVHDGTAYERVGYIDIDQFVTVCFTRKGAEEFIARMKHRLNKPHIDVDTFHRNAEMIALRNHLMGDDKP